jgi:RHS repeat-associated protein
VTNQSFSLHGPPQTVVDGSGTHALTYDWAGRLLTDTVGDVQVANTYSPVYGLTNRSVLTNAVAVFDHGYGYDALGRLNAVTNGAVRVSYSYLPKSDLVQTITGKSNTTTVLTTTKRWEYGGRLAAISHSTNGAPIQAFDYGYDNLQRRVRSTWADGSSWYYGYDDRDQVTSGKRAWSDSIAVAGQQYEFGYDAIGNRLQQKSGGDAGGLNLRTTTYTNNALNELTGLGTPSSLDVIGSAYATATVTINGGATYRKDEYYRADLTVANTGSALAQGVTNTATQGINSTSVTGTLLVPKASSILGYDADGNLTNDSLWHYKWDAENRLAQMTNSMAIATASRKKLTFQYDSEGRRVSKTVYPWGTSNYSGTPSTAQKFVYEGWLLLAETTNTDAPQRSYAWGLDLSGTMNEAAGIGGLLNATHYGSTNSTNLLVVFDGNGNVTALVGLDKKTQTIYEYNPFGETIRASGALATFNPFRFSTKFADDETELSYYGYRYYSANNGRWVGRDPKGEDGGLNLFGFTQNSPIHRVDPFGLTSGSLPETGGTAAIGSGVGGSVGAAAGNIVRGVRDMVNAYNNIQNFTDMVSGGFDETEDDDEFLIEMMAAANNSMSKRGSTGSKSVGTSPGGSPLGPQHGGNKHWDRITKIAKAMINKGWTDVRINKRQVDAKGNEVGLNRPDISGVNPITQQRHNIEIDSTRASSRHHQTVVNKNDPNAKNTYIVLP